MNREKQIKIMLEAEARANESLRNRMKTSSYRDFIESFDSRIKGEPKSR